MVEESTLGCGAILGIGAVGFLGGAYLGYTRAIDGSAEGDYTALLVAPAVAGGVGAIVANLTPDRGGSIDGYPLWPVSGVWVAGAMLAGELFGAFAAYLTR